MTKQQQLEKVHAVLIETYYRELSADEAMEQIEDYIQEMMERKDNV